MRSRGLSKLHDGLPDFDEANEDRRENGDAAQGERAVDDLLVFRISNFSH